jgi:FtsZ-binding cell division protein ZapB
MISELNDDDILEFLMTSDFEGDYKPGELKYLLIKWRYFYRILYSRSSNSKDDLSFEISELKKEIESLKNNITELQKDNADKENFIQALKVKRLTWKERLTGKINNTDEN